MKKLIYLYIVSLVILSCSKTEKGDKDIGAANRARMQEFYDQVMNAHNTAMVDSFCTSDFIDHQAEPNTPPGIEGLRATFNGYFSAFPDIKFKTNTIMASGDTVMAHISITGTNSGSYMGKPATNKQINIEGVDIVVLKDGKATEHWGFEEDMKMMAQLGMGPGAMPDKSDVK